jgi:Rrf2 family iron-sulfur cluster assembly transcriptional regulator
MEMLLSTKRRLAVRAMVDVALQAQIGPVSLSVMSLRLQISRPYLEVIFSQLRRKGLVVSTRGHMGGFSLGRASNSITLAHIIEAVKSKPQGESSAKLHSHKPEMPDPTKELFKSLDLQMRRYMQSIKLCDLVDEQIKKDMKFDTITVERHDAWSKGNHTFEPNSVSVNTNAAARQAVRHR